MFFRVYKMPDGRTAKYSISKKYFGGHYVNDGTKPIYEERTILAGHENDEAKTPIYEKKTVFVGYEQIELTIADVKIPDILMVFPL